MHETAICQSLLRELNRVAEQHAARRLKRVVIEVGPLSGVEAPLLRRAFSILTPGSIADGAELEIRRAPVRVLCRECGAESEARVNRLVCACCSHWQVTVIEGDELTLRQVELEPSPPDTRQSTRPGEIDHVH